MKGFYERILLLVGLFTAWLILMVLPFQVLGQITIEEELELSSDSTIHPQPQKTSMMTTASSNGPVIFEVEQAGPLEIVFEKGRRFKESFQKTKIDISIKGPDGKVKYKRKISPADYFSDPVQGRLTPECSDMWYLYGEGPFNWHSGTSTDVIDDAKVFSLGCNTDWAQSNGRCRTTNLGSGGGLKAIAWTYWWVPALTRSFVQFNGLEFSGPVQLEQAYLNLYEVGGRWGSWPLSGSNAFYISRVTSNWSESSVTWNTQPSQGSPRVSGPGGTSNAEVDVSPIVQTWMDNPGSNYGFGLALKNEQYYRNRSFYDSEGQVPPELNVEVSSPEARLDTLEVAQVRPGDVVTLEYESNGEVFASNTETQKTINGEETAGREFIFNVYGPTCGTHGFSEHLEAFGWVELPDEIMLGESKYYATVKHPDEPQKILIKSVNTDSKGVPVKPANFVANPGFGSSPIEIISGGKSGVYWEDKWATIGSNGTIQTGSLPSGMIRLIGRYWKAGKEYKVNLTTKDGRGNLTIKVVKPDRLGDKFGKARDVFDDTLDVDSLIIDKAGKYGIPPQIIKAHISIEAEDKDFGGNIGSGFAPSYRYEPYTTQFADYLEYWSGKYFIEDSSLANFSNVPNHQHVKPRDYFREPKTVWEVIKENSQLVNPNGPILYGKRIENGRMDFYPRVYYTIQNKYNEIYLAYSLFNFLAPSQVADSTNKTMATYLRKYWEGGAENIIAQTRTASSYGYLQMLYTTASDVVDFSKDRVPENMNVVNFFGETVSYQKDLIQKYLGKEIEVKNNWPNGYEKSFMESIFPIWNPGGDKYPRHVMKRVENFRPHHN